MWLLGRILYAVAYDRAPEKRIAGFIISVAATIVLIIGAAFGLVMLAMLWMVD